MYPTKPIQRNIFLLLFILSFRLPSFFDTLEKILKSLLPAL